MKYISPALAATLAAVLSAPASAHTGHVAQVAGHTHSLMDLIAYGTVPALALGAFVVWVSLRTRSK